MVRDGLISRQEFLTFYGKVLQNSDDDAFEKGIERFYSSSKIVTNEKIDNLKNEVAELREEVERVAAENRALRAAAP